MKYELSGHARTVISERGIQPEWVERVLDRPDLVREDRDDAELEHRLGVVKEHGGRVPRVMINKTTTPVRLVTAYFDRAMKGRL